MTENPYLLRLNLGAGKVQKKDYVNIDVRPDVHPDVVLDLEKAKLPYGESTVDEITSSHTLEHIANIIPLMAECWRVLKPNAVFSAVVPIVCPGLIKETIEDGKLKFLVQMTPEMSVKHSKHRHAWQDLTHKPGSFFTENTFLYFDRGDAKGLGKIYDWGCDFKVEKNEVSGDVNSPMDIMQVAVIMRAVKPLRPQ